MPGNNNPFSDNISSLEDDQSIFNSANNEKKEQEETTEKVENKVEYNDIYNYRIIMKKC